MRTVFSWYFAANDVNLKILNRGKQVLSYRLPSFGTFSTALDPIYSFGIPRQVKMSGIMVDVDAVVNSLWGRNNDANLARTFGQQLGLIASALEHRIPELFFTSEEHPGEAVSAVKALAVASAEGQRIYQVTSANVNNVLPMLNVSAEVKNEIRNSVTVGKVVTVSQSNITVGGWTGVGYIVIDPETGAGAYRISRGNNGGFITLALINSIFIITLFLYLAFVISSFIPLLLVLLILTIASTSLIGQFDQNVFWGLTSLLFAIANFSTTVTTALALTTSVVWWAGFLSIVIGTYALWLTIKPYLSQRNEGNNFVFLRKLPERRLTVGFCYL